MKTWMITLVFLYLALIPLQAQYHPTVGENRHWIFQEHFSNDQPGVIGANMLSMEGDTVVGSLTYKKIYSSRLKGTNPCQGNPCFKPYIPYQVTNRGLFALVREDTLARKVYHLPIGFSVSCESEEYELFDFSLQESDSLSDCLAQSIGAEQDPKAGLVDSIRTELLYGKNRRTMYTTGLIPIVGLQFFGPIRISEGIGFNTFGLFNRRNNLMELIDFCEGNWEECQIISALRTPPSPLNIAVYPNPTTDKVWLETDQLLVASTLYNAQGQVVYRGREAVVDLSALPQGIYLWRVEFAGGEWTVQKVLRGE